MAEPDRQPVLEGAHVALRPLRPDDWEALYAVASDPLIWEIHPAHDRWQEPVFRAFFADALASGGALAILDRATGRIIGSSRYDNHDAATGEIEIGWTFLARDHWGGTCNREVKRLMLDHIFRFVEVAVFLVGETNHRSRRAMEKIGGVERDEVRERPLGGGIARHVVYEIRKGAPAPAGAPDPDARSRQSIA